MAKIPEFTQEQYHDFARSIDDGSYFQNARKWYTVVYMALLPERCFFIVMMLIASCAGVFSIISLLMLLPLAPAQPVLLPMRDVIRDLPIITPLRESSYQPINDALQRFFVRQYLTKREGYSFDTIQSNFRFLRNYSNTKALRVYLQEINPSSPKSPINRYERSMKRDIAIEQIMIQRADGEEETWDRDGRYIATVYFVADVHTLKESTKTRWRADITFDYVQLKMIQPVDLKEGKPKVVPMKFTVTDYYAMEEVVVP